MRPEALQRPRRRGPLVVAAVALAVVPMWTSSLAGAQPTVAGQEDPGSGTEEPPAEDPPEQPPATIAIGDGDYGVVPPGGAPPETGPDPGSAPDSTTAPPPEVAAPTGAVAPALPDPTPGLNAAMADLAVGAATRVADAARASWQSARQATTVASRFRTVRLTAERRALAAARAALDARNALAVNALMFGDMAGLDPLIGAPGLDDLRNAELRDATAEHLQERLEGAVQRWHRSARSSRTATAALERLRRAEERAAADHLGARAALAARVSEARDARRADGPAIVGAIVLDRDDLLAWYHTYYRGQPRAAPIETIIDAYLKVGSEEGVTGDIAFAQAILETGGFGSGHARSFNFAGIGVRDSCAPDCGLTFRGVEAGVRAHIHLLRAFAQAGLSSADLAVPPDRRIAPERIGVRGCCPRWTTLTGTWATDPDYDRKVLGIYRLMVQIAQERDRRPGSGPPTAPPDSTESGPSASTS